MSRPNLFFIVGLAVYTLSMRLMPWALSHFGVAIDFEHTFYPWNFSPMSAFCLFGAAYYGRKSLAFLLPVLVWLLGDFGIWALTGKIEWAFHSNMLTVYSGYLLIAALGLWLRGKRSLPAVWCTGLVGQTLYFLLTNFGVWYFSMRYSKDAAGLSACYIAGLPFLGKSVASMLFFTTLIFRPYILQERKAAVVVSEKSSVTAS